METLTALIQDRILDPVVIVPAIALNAAVFSGVAARLAERVQERQSRRVGRQMATR